MQNRSQCVPGVRESRFSSRFRIGIGSSYVGTDGPARTVDEAQIYLYSCANSPLLQEERMGCGRPEGRAKRCVGVRTICECHCATHREPRLDMRDGETVKYTAQYFAGARFVAVSPKLTRNSNCYMRHRTPRIYVDTWWREKNYQAIGITERVAVGVSGSNVVTRKCCIDVNLPSHSVIRSSSENWKLKQLFNEIMDVFFH